MTKTKESDKYEISLQTKEGDKIIIGEVSEIPVDPRKREEKENGYI
jgi:hypothetical protein